VQVEADVTATLQLLTPTGRLLLPVRLLARRALPTLSPDGVVEVGARGGGVMVAARAERTITISNAGALDVTYDIKVGGRGADGVQRNVLADRPCCQRNVRVF
jgi:hypothetical protein